MKKRSCAEAHKGFSRWVFVLGVFLALGTFPVHGRSDQFKPTVNTQVAAAKRLAPELGVHVVDLQSGETVYEYKADTPRVLASNTKLFTSAAALDRLGPGYFFETPILIRGDLRDGTLEGDLIIVGGGDPNLSGRQYFGDSYGPFREWAAALAAQGIERIAGHMILVHGFFDDSKVHPQWPRDQLTRWYEAPVEALSFNDNCVLVKVAPGAPGRPGKVSTVPELDLFRLEASVQTVTNPRQQLVRIDRRSGAESHVLEASGRIYRSANSVDKWVAVADPLSYFGAALRQALEEEGIPFVGSVVHQEGFRGAAQRVHTHRTDLLTVLEVVNKRSQNFYAESVLKTLGARLCGDGTWEAGVRAVDDFLAQAGLDSDAYELVDGSGMSRGNRSSPRQVTRLLGHMFQHPHAKEFVGTLPYGGERGLSWEKRLATPPYAGNVMAKTGTLRSVSTLSGYAKARSGKIYAFSILLNSVRSGRARDAQDRIVRAVIDQG